MPSISITIDKGWASRFTPNTSYARGNDIFLAAMTAVLCYSIFIRFRNSIHFMQSRANYNVAPGIHT